MAARLDYRWHLRQVMASRGMFATTDLIGPLADREIRLSSSQVYRLVTERPERLSLRILMALLDILDCAMTDLIEPAPPPARTRRPGRPAARPASAACGRGEPGSSPPVTDPAGDAVTDPVGVMVTLIAGVEHGLGRDAIRAAVTAVAGGRAKQRRLALALAGRPGVLSDGRSPASRAVGDLLIALVRAGAAEISPPACAQCGKALRTLQRRGDDWYCAVCGEAREPCAACGRLRRLSSRDRSGRPRCTECPDGDGRDPVDVIHGIVAALDPGTGREAVADAVCRCAPRPSYQQKLAWAIEGNPALLTGDGHLSPLRAVLRLIEMLDDAGVAGVVRPSCGRCGRVVRIDKPLDGVRVCRTCIAHSRAEPCGRCGAVREPVTRDGQGRPLCANCMISDPVNLEACVNCGRRRVVNTRSPDGPLCPGCPPLPALECSVCGQRRPCGISRLTGLPWCPPCQALLARCSGCGQVGPVGSGTLAEPRCRDCTIPVFPDCAACADSLRPGQCASCLLELRLRELLSGPDGGIRPSLGPLRKALAATDPPGTALRWLAKPPVAAALSGIAADGRDLSHGELDRLEQTPVLAHLRSVLVATGTLPPRDEQMARLERFTADVIDGRPDPEQRQVLRCYATWHLLRRLRGRNNGRPVTREQHSVVQQQVRGAVALLDWLDARGQALSTCGQADLDEWLPGSGTSRNRDAGHFVRWAARQRLTPASIPALRWRRQPGRWTTRPAGTPPAGSCTTTRSVPGTGSPGCSSCSTPSPSPGSPA